MKTITIKTKLKNGVIKIKDAGELNGKDVQITISELIKKNNQKNKWNYSGVINLNRKADKLNLRDFAYE
ncbi:MAG: hypothetical protein ABI840_12160 [bacterium]